MTEHHKFSKLTKDFSPERKAKIADRTAKLKKEMALTELRQNKTLLVALEMKCFGNHWRTQSQKRDLNKS